MCWLPRGSYRSGLWLSGSIMLAWNCTRINQCANGWLVNRVEPLDQSDMVIRDELDGGRVRGVASFGSHPQWWYRLEKQRTRLSWWITWVTYRHALGVLWKRSNTWITGIALFKYMDNSTGNSIDKYMNLAAILFIYKANWISIVQIHG